MTTAETKVCPSCGDRNLSVGKDVKTNRTGLFCLCGHVEFTDAKPKHQSALKLPGLDPGPQHKRIHELEKQLVHEIEVTLKTRGFIVLHVDQWRADTAGSTEGTPDLFFTHPRWLALNLFPVGLWHPMEVKLPGEKARPAQQVLIDLGVSVIVDSVGAAVGAAEEVDDRMRRLAQRGNA